MITLSVVSPVYQAQTSVPILVSRIKHALASLPVTYEIILVDDRSQDASWRAIQDECLNSSNVRGLRLSRNFGQHAAITAGLKISTGDWVVVMDCDLQDRPEQIPHLLEVALKGHDVVHARRVLRRDSGIKKLYSAFFYSIFSFLTSTRQDATIANFGIYKRNVIEAILSMGDHIRYFPAMVQWVGFNPTSIDVEHSTRYSGVSSYTLLKMIRLAINTIISFSDKPLKIVAQVGLILSFISICIGLFFLAGSIAGFVTVPGYASIIVSIWLTAGINIFVLGIVGIYVGKAFELIKGRPIYIVDEVAGCD